VRIVIRAQADGPQYCCGQRAEFSNIDFQQDVLETSLSPVSHQAFNPVHQGIVYADFWNLSKDRVISANFVLLLYYKFNLLCFLSLVSVIGLECRY
jgi:hypothetical protein